MNGVFPDVYTSLAAVPGTSTGRRRTQRRVYLEKCAVHGFYLYYQNTIVLKLQNFRLIADVIVTVESWRGS